MSCGGGGKEYLYKNDRIEGYRKFKPISEKKRCLKFKETRSLGGKNTVKLEMGRKTKTHANRKFGKLTRNWGN